MPLFVGLYIAGFHGSFNSGDDPPSSGLYTSEFMVMLCYVFARL